MVRQHHWWIIAVLVAVVGVLSGCTLGGQLTPSDSLQVLDVTSQEAFDLIQKNHVIQVSSFLTCERHRNFKTGILKVR